MVKKAFLLALLLCHVSCGRLTALRPLFERHQAANCTLSSPHHDLLSFNAVLTSHFLVLVRLYDANSPASILVYLSFNSSFYFYCLLSMLGVRLARFPFLDRSSLPARTLLLLLFTSTIRLDSCLSWLLIPPFLLLLIHIQLVLLCLHVHTFKYHYFAAILL